MVKKFRRSAAGLEEQLPSDLRPPPVLKQTCDYLLDEMIGKARTLGDVHHFVWDRTRAIRNDFSIQQVQKREELMIAVECYERIARFHIVSLHQLALPEKPYSKYDWQQEREQLDRTLLSLMQLYDDSRERIPLANEAEFRAYCVILQLQDPTPDLEDRIQSWPRRILHDRRVQKAIEVYMAACNIMDPQGPLKPRADHLIARQDWQKFWTLVASKEVSYLMACAAEVYFNLVRRMVLNAIFRTSWQANSKHRADAKTTEWTIDVLCDLLAFDDGDEVYTYCEHFGFAFRELEDGQHYLDLPSVSGTSLPEPSAGIPKQSKTHLVEDKRFGRTLPGIINGLTVKEAQDTGLVAEQEEQAMDMDDAMDSGEQHGQTVDAPGNSDPFDDGESLFIPEKQPSTLFQSPPISTLANGARETASGSGSGSFNFGKPSSLGDDSTFQNSKPKESNTAAPKFDFFGTSNTATTMESPFSFTGTSKASDIGTTTNTTFAASAPGSTEPSQRSQDIFSKPFAPPAVAAPSFLSTSTAAPATASDSQSTTSPKSKFPSFSPAATLANSEGAKNDAAQSQATRNHFSFMQPPATPATPLPRQPSSSPEMKSSQPHFTTTPPQQSSTLNPPISTPGQNLGARKLSSSRDHRPEKPSPLSHSFTAGDDSSAIIDSHPSQGLAGKATLEGPFPAQQNWTRTGASSYANAQTTVSPEPPGESFAAIVERVADEFYTDPIRGILKQYIDYHIRQTVREVQDEIETERLHEEAEKYNRFRLHTKYGRRWRDLFWQKRLAKSGRERRERRRRRLEQRSSQEFDGSRILDAQSSRPQSQMSSVVGAEEFGVRQSVEVNTYERLPSFQNVSHHARATEQPHTGMKRPMSSHETEDFTQPKQYSHKRMKSTSHIDQRGRVAKFGTPTQPENEILKRSSFLGFSPSNIGGTLKNTMKTSYFRLKAMGVHRVDEEVAPRGTKRPLSALGQSSMQTSPPALRPTYSLGRSSARPSDRTMMPPPSQTPTRPATANYEDDELLARLRAARENLKDGTTFLKSEVEKDQGFRRSLKSSASSNEFESPSMARARSEARLRASQRSPDGRASVARSDVPSYRLRESRFVPREHYGKAIERAREIRESRSRDTSRPESPQMHGALQTESTKAPLPAPSFGPSNTTCTASNLDGNPTQRPNGVSKNQSAHKGVLAFAPTSTSTTLVSRPPISFANHTTQISSDNPFLEVSTSKPFSGFASQQTAALKGCVPPENTSLRAERPNDASAQDHTIQPSQINQALANSWGSSHGYGTNKQLSIPHDMETPLQQDSYLQSQAISLFSDDEDETPQSAQHTPREDLVDTEATEDVNEELVEEESEDDEITQLNGHNPHTFMEHGDTEEDEELGQESEEDEAAETNGHVNPYALLARQDMDEDQESYDSQIEQDEGYEQEVYADRIPNGYVYGQHSDEEGMDGDIDEDDTEEAEYDEDAEAYDYSDEDGDETQQAHWQQQQYDARWASQPPKSFALQGVGDSAEEAIELSD